LQQRGVERIGIEASGGYEQAVVSFLRADDFVVIVFQPVQVRAYAKFVLQHAKNDNIDAALIASCAAAATDIHEPPDTRLAPLAQRLTMIEQLTQDVAQLKTRREACRDQRIRIVLEAGDRQAQEAPAGRAQAAGRRHSRAS
jgi:transposase